jgi:hypothetical protein
LEFEVGDYVYLKVSPMKGVHRFGVRGKLAPRYVGPLEFEVGETSSTLCWALQDFGPAWSNGLSHSAP